MNPNTTSATCVPTRVVSVALTCQVTLCGLRCECLEVRWLVSGIRNSHLCVAFSLVGCGCTWRRDRWRTRPHPHDPVWMPDAAESSCHCSGLSRRRHAWWGAGPDPHDPVRTPDAAELSRHFSGLSRWRSVSTTSWRAASSNVLPTWLGSTAHMA